MKKCPNCGKDLLDDASFCDGCGASLNSTENSIPENSAPVFTQTEIVPEKKKSKKGVVIAIIVAAVVIIALLSMCSSEDTETYTVQNTTTEPISYESTEAPTAVPTAAPTSAPAKKEFVAENYGYVDYSELARNPDNYTGKSLTYSGKVIQVIEGDTETQHRIAVNGDYDSVVYVSYPKNIVTSRILEDDYVRIYGTSLGLISYTSTIGGKITIPAIYLDRIELQ